MPGTRFSVDKIVLPKAKKALHVYTYTFLGDCSSIYLLILQINLLYSTASFATLSLLLVNVVSIPNAVDTVGWRGAVLMLIN